ncbi:MAG: rRNA maturation RNase YbeY [Bacteroidia bacterium]
MLFHSEGVNFSLPLKRHTKNWLRNTILSESKLPGNINIIFVDDTHLLNINKQYLKHNTFTDIITFDYTVKNLISGDIFISIDRVKDNSTRFNVSFLQELQRVIIHGVLHLCGFTDKTDIEKQEMRNKEDNYLSLRPEI